MLRVQRYKLSYISNETQPIIFDFIQACTRSYEGDNPESDKRLMVLKKGMSLNYQHHWIVDNMPVTWCYPLEGTDRQFCSTGFPMGCLVRHHPDGVSF